MQRVLLFGLLATVLAATGLALWLTSDTQIVKRRVYALFDAATFSSPLSTSASHLRARRLDTLLADSVALSIPEARLEATHPRGEILAGFLFFLSDTHDCAFSDVRILSLTIDDSSADARVTFRPRITSSTPYASTQRVLTLRLARTPAGWRITAIAVDP